MSDKLHVMAEAVRSAYNAGEEDEALSPRVLVDNAGLAMGRIGDHDLVIFYDIRGEREVQLTRAFVEPGFPPFATAGRVARFTTMIEYHSELPVAVAFPPEVAVRGTLGEALAAAGKRVVKVVESEKAVHLSYFLNGKREAAFPGERLSVVESRKDVANYDQAPEMSAAEVTARVLAELRGDADVIVVNYANIDVVGHLQDAAAVVAAVETVDRELGRVLAAAEAAGVTAIVTADHGTVEKWLYPDGKIDTGHTDSPVPLALVGPGLKGVTLRPGGALTDVAPTLLDLLGLPVPPEMTGASLILGQPAGATAGRALLIICDGWGERAEDYGNMIRRAATPVMDRLRAERPFTALAAAGEAVGMPAGKVGNSEAGHLHLGAGRRLLSDRQRIDAAIADGSFRSNPAFAAAMDVAVREGRALHLLGIVSFYSSHGSVEHLYELLKMARERGVGQVFHHALLGRRGERPEAGARYIDDVEALCEQLGLGRVVTVMGRFWALDRENNWDRVERAYRALADGVGVPITDGQEQP
jgi:2,3-bisphosphoglycerate-independent phosphoglycerate mutase